MRSVHFCVSDGCALHVLYCSSFCVLLEAPCVFCVLHNTCVESTSSPSMSLDNIVIIRACTVVWIQRILHNIVYHTIE